MIQQGESAAWLRLSLDPARRPAVLKDELVEAVVPSTTAWTVRDLRLGAKDGEHVAQAWQEAQAISPDVQKVLSAEVCFTAWDQVTVRKVSTVAGAAAQRAQHLMRGMYAAGPNVLRPGGSFLVAVFAGSLDGTVPLDLLKTTRR